MLRALGPLILTIFLFWVYEKVFIPWYVRYYKIPEWVMVLPLWKRILYRKKIEAKIKRDAKEAEQRRIEDELAQLRANDRRYVRERIEKARARKESKSNKAS